MSFNSNLSTSYQSDSYQSGRVKDPAKVDDKELTTSPSKKHRSLPVMRSPEKTKNPLPAPAVYSSPQPDDATTDQFKSPVGVPTLRLRSVKSPSDAGDSPRSVRSPKSPRSEHEVMSSRRHRIDSPRAKLTAQQQVPAFVSALNATVVSTVTQTVTQTVTSSTGTNQGAVAPDKIARQRLSAPPNTIILHKPSPEQMNDLADLWIQKTLGLSTKKGTDVAPLTDAKINALGRTDGKVAVSALPEILRDLKISADKQGKVELNGLLRSMLANHLAQSDAGKTIKTMQLAVLNANPKLAAIHFDDMIALDDPDAETELRQTMASTARTQAEACVDVAFGPSRKLSECHLPQDLLNFWKLIDARLVMEAKKNPALSKEQVLKARSNLGFDLLITRQLYPFALKPAPEVAATETKQGKVTANMALPVLVTVFATTMSDAFLQAWPAFCADAIKHFDA